MLGAALVALGQTDIKRVLAWSTVSQLAYMMAALSVGSRDAAIFHLLSHAFFKALLFLAAGVVILAVGSSAFTSMHGLRAKLPVTFATMTVGLLALVGVFPFAGFFSKESVLVAAEHAADGDGPVAAWVGWMVLLVAVVTIAVTAAYALRLWLLTWSGGTRSEVRETHDRSALLTGPLVRPH
jgi:NADH-quinone oxidoreductase subunit L